MKKTLIVSALLTSAVVAQASGYDYLVINQQDGTQQALPVSGLTITFNNDNLVANANGTTATFALQNLASMYFSDDDPSGISDAVSGEPTTIRVSSRLIQVSAPAGSQVTIANVGGMLIDRYTTGSDAINTPVRPGFYLIKVNEKATKVYVK